MGGIYMTDKRIILKRDGREVEFSLSKITHAIYEAAKAVGDADMDRCTITAEKVYRRCCSDYGSESMWTVEQIQDAVEKVLIKGGHDQTAKAYIVYRHERSRARDIKTNIMNTIANIVGYGKEKDSGITRENANIDGDDPMAIMLRFGEAANKEFNSLNVIDPKYMGAHDEGDIHMHDCGFYSLTTTCVEIDLAKLFKNGFNPGHGFLREPNSIKSYAALACIAIQANQNNQHR
jgi:ribonucleoside-triphosphate reductase